MEIPQILQFLAKGCVTGYKPFGSPNMGEFLFPVMKQFLGKGDD